MLILRQATIDDHPFLVRIDLKNDGYSSSNDAAMTEHEKERHSEKIMKYVTDPDKGAFIVEDTDTSQQVGMIMYSIANRDLAYPWETIYDELDRHLFQANGRFLEVFQLWVHPDFRRRGLATQLKLKLETAAQSHDVNLIYTHTEEINGHVIELNKKLGYREVRRGPIWDAVTRVSLIKQLL